MPLLFTETPTTLVSPTYFTSDIPSIGDLLKKGENKIDNFWNSVQILSFFAIFIYRKYTYNKKREDSEFG